MKSWPLSSGFDSMIGSTESVNGEIVVNGHLIVNGNIKGSILTAQVTGNSRRQVTINGIAELSSVSIDGDFFVHGRVQVDGDVKVSGHLKLSKGGFLSAKRIEYGILHVDGGSFVNGELICKCCSEPESEE